MIESAIMKQIFLLLFPIFLFIACTRQTKNSIASIDSITPVKNLSLIILGTIQDGGSPHPGCKKDCCKNLFHNLDPNRKVTCLGLVDPENKQTWLFEASPDMPVQMKLLKEYAGFREQETPDGIFLTHAHIGHYTGLMYLGKEAMGTKEVPVYAMPRMKKFLEENGPWSQLVSQKNIVLNEIEAEKEIKLNDNISVRPFVVPHRDEFSETVGYIITGKDKSVLFIPDINKWEIWNKKIMDEIAKVDYAFIDGTFYDGDEINTKTLSGVPHPFIIESLQLFKDLPISEKKKIRFIHFNHTNPLLDPKSDKAAELEKAGFNIARFGDIIGL
jgi:pyrroloquinoline quinone biosynthesis protein B